MSNKLKNAANAGDTTPANLNQSEPVNASPDERLAISNRWQGALGQSELAAVIKIPAPLNSIKGVGEEINIESVYVTFWPGRDFKGLDSVPALAIGVMHSGYKEDASVIAFEKGISAGISAVIGKPVSIQRVDDEDWCWMNMQGADLRSRWYLADIILRRDNCGNAVKFPAGEE